MKRAATIQGRSSQADLEVLIGVHRGDAKVDGRGGEGMGLDEEGGALSLSWQDRTNEEVASTYLSPK